MLAFLQEQQFDYQTAWMVAKVVGGGILALLSVVGFSAIALYLVKHFIPRFTSKRDKKEERETANEGKKLDMDAVAFADTTARLLRLEKKCDTLQDSLTKVMTNNAGLTAENGFLKQENTRLEKELERTRERVRYLEDELTHLRIDIEALTNWQRVDDESSGSHKKWTPPARPPLQGEPGGLPDPLNVHIVEDDKEKE